MKLSTLALALALLLGLAPCAWSAPDRVRAESGRYVVESSGTEAEADEYARMLEAAWPQFAEFFGKEPKLARGARLAVKLFEDDASFRAAIQAGGGTPPEAGGYYCPLAKTAYVKRQPSAWYTRTLLLHEAAHQFHFLACTGNANPTAAWYVEGVAEHLGSHSWDGETLRVGVLPLVSLEDRAGIARLSVDDGAFGLSALLASEPVDRPVSMMLVRFLRESERRKAFDALARKMDRGTLPTGRAFTRTFGKEPQLLAEWRAWLASNQEPLVSVFIEWDSRGPAHVRGTAEVVSFCRTREVVRRVSARVEPPAAGGFRAGVLLQYTDADNYAVATVVRRPDASAEAKIQVDRLVDGKWSGLLDAVAPAAEAGVWSVAAERVEGGVSFLVGEARFGPFDLPPSPLGFVVDNCRAEFREIAIEP